MVEWLYGIVAVCVVLVFICCIAIELIYRFDDDYIAKKSSDKIERIFAIMISLPYIGLICMIAALIIEDMS